MQPAFAVPVVLNITFDGFPEETGFGIFSRADADAPGLNPLFDIGGPPAIAFTGGSGMAVSENCDFDPTSPACGFAPIFEFFLLAVPFDAYDFIWDLAAGDYSFFIVDAFGDGLCFIDCGAYSLSVDGTVVGSGGDFFDYERIDFTVAAVAVPEPGTLALLGIGLAGMGFTRRRRKV